MTESGIGIGSNQYQVPGIGIGIDQHQVPGIDIEKKTFMLPLTKNDSDYFVLLQSNRTTSEKKIKKFTKTKIEFSPFVLHIEKKENYRAKHFIPKYFVFQTLRDFC